MHFAEATDSDAIAPFAGLPPLEDPYFALLCADKLTTIVLPVIRELRSS